MSEAVVDDIVAVLPPLLQSLEALGFIARYLNPPDFDRVMAARRRAGRRPARRASAARAMAGGIRRHQDRRWRRRAMRRSPRSTACASCKTAMAISSACSARCVTPRARRRRCIRWSAKLPPVSQFFVDPVAARGRRSCGAAGGAGQRKHRHLPQPQRARQPRRLLALRAGILHARPRLAAGDGAARRQRQRPRFPVELAARRPQPRRDPGRADRRPAAPGH